MSGRLKADTQASGGKADALRQCTLPAAAWRCGAHAAQSSAVLARAVLLSAPPSQGRAKLAVPGAVHFSCANDLRLRPKIERSQIEQVLFCFALISAVAETRRGESRGGSLFAKTINKGLSGMRQ